MALIESFLDIVSGWDKVFAQERSSARATKQAISSLCAVGRRTLSRAIFCAGDEQKDWSAEYRLHSRSVWSPRQIFKPILAEAVSHIDEDVIAVAYDDTKLKKTGEKIKSASWQRDPMSPPFNVNLILALRFLQASLLLPLYKKDSNSPPRGIPVEFTECSSVKKPKFKSTEGDWANYRLAIKKQNLSQTFLSSMQSLREELDCVGAHSKKLLVTVDGSFCNRTCLNFSTERTAIVARARKDAKLCFTADSGSRKKYDDKKFTPEMIRVDEKIPWKIMSVFHGGKYREVRYKEVTNVLWQRGTKTKPIKVIVIAPTPYRLTKKARLYYRNPAYLFCTDQGIKCETYIQKYFDRWQIEVNNREEKDTLGVGQAQVRSERSVSRQPAFIVASYAALLLAGLNAFGTKRGENYLLLPKWRRSAKRASCLDLISILRKEIAANQSVKEKLDANYSLETMATRAAA